MTLKGLLYITWKIINDSCPWQSQYNWKCYQLSHGKMYVALCIVHAHMCRKRRDFKAKRTHYTSLILKKKDKKWIKKEQEEKLIKNKDAPVWHSFYDISPYQKYRNEHNHYVQLPVIIFGEKSVDKKANQCIVLNHNIIPAWHNDNNWNTAVDCRECPSTLQFLRNLKRMA